MNGCADASIPVTWGVGNVGFPSGDFDAPDAFGVTHLSAYGTNDQMVQAQSLVRLLLTFWAYGADNVLWFSHMGTRAGTAGGEFTMMGLRNDTLIDEGVAIPDATEADGGWAKASWWAFQRLCSFVARAAHREVLFNEGGFVGIRMTAGLRGFVDLGETTPTVHWRYAFVFWLDGVGANVTATYVDVTLSVPTGYARMPLVPENTSFASSGTGSAYAESSAPDWGVSGLWFGHCRQQVTASLPGFVTVRIWPSRDDSAEPPAPRLAAMRHLGIVAWLSNGSTVTRALPSPDLPFP